MSISQLSLILISTALSSSMANADPSIVASDRAALGFKKGPPRAANKDTNTATPVPFATTTPASLYTTPFGKPGGAAAPSPVVTTPRPLIVVPPAVAPNNQPAQQDQNAQSIVDAMKGIMEGGQRDKSGEPDGQDGAPDKNTDWNSYAYPDGYKFNSSDVGAGNIGNGLCTQNNANRAQVKDGYCQMLNDIINDPNSCANHYMNRVLAKANSGQYRDLGQYCSDFGQLKDNSQRSLVFLQILSGLITKESGWNTNATEGQWYKNGHAMGGVGLFQIGASDSGQDRDCSGIGSNLKNPKANLKCGACIALKDLSMDNTVGSGSGDSGARGLARYFGPFRELQANKRGDIERSVNTYCQANAGGNPSKGMAADVGQSASSN
jgi:hypothetical protein